MEANDRGWLSAALPPSPVAGPCTHWPEFERDVDEDELGADLGRQAQRGGIRDLRRVPRSERLAVERHSPIDDVQVATAAAPEWCSSRALEGSAEMSNVS
jgi:hypothetical protein